MLNRKWRSAAFTLPVLVLSAACVSGFEEVWSARFRPSGGGNEKGMFAASDAEGNTFVAGTAVSLDPTTYYGSYTVTLKYAPTGEILWTKSMHSEFTTYPVALSVDASGAAYVAASWDDDDVESRARIIKFNPGDRAGWMNEFRGVARDDDESSTARPEALVPHPGGGAFLLCDSPNGKSLSSVLLSYGPDGNELWRAERADAFGSVMALDPEGGVIIAGGSASGIRVFRYRDDGTERPSVSASIGVWMDPQAIAVAPDGTLHAAGSSGLGLGTVVKLDPGGNLLGWAIAAAGESIRIAGLALLSGGDVVVAGSAGPWRDPAGFVLKLDPDVRELWRADFGGRDLADVRDMAVGSDGIVRIAGSIGTRGSRDYWTAALDPSGAVLRESRHDGGGEDVAAALSIDTAGNIHVTGASHGRHSSDIVTVSYGSGGTERWASRFERRERTHVYHVEVDGDGNTIVAGGSGRHGDLLVYDPNGALLSAKDFPFDASDESPYGLAIDPSGNSFIAAGELRKLDPAGNTLWIQAGPPWYRCIEQAPGGDLYAAGWDHAGGRERGVLAKLDPAGKEIWRRNPPETIGALVLDAQGPLIISRGLGDSAVIQYDAAGEVLWSAVPQERFYGTKLAVDSSGSVYVLGTGIVKLDASGSLLWAKPYGNHWFDLAPDRDGHVYAIDAEYSLVKLTPEGDEVWKTGVLGSSSRIFLDAAGSAFVSGVLPGGDEPALYLVAELDPGGRIVDHLAFGPAYCCVTAPRLAFHPGGDLIVSAPSSSEYLTLRLRRSGASEFIRGDANGDGAVLMDDAIGSLDWLFRGGAEPACGDAADSNDDGLIEITDAVYTLGHLFMGGPSPPPPYPGKGRDPTADSLACGS